MIEIVGTAVAMGNTTEKVNLIADFVTEDNEHDSVAKAIESLISAEI